MTNPPNDIIFQYVRNRRREKVGIVAALRIPNNKVGIGWSLCATQKGDKFDAVKALDIAIGRAEKAGGIDTIPQSVSNDYEVMIDRANRYFKNAEVIF